MKAKRFFLEPEHSDSAAKLIASMRKPKNKQTRKAPVAEVLEPRVLFSGDSLSALGAALLPDNNPAESSLNQIGNSLELANAINDSANDEHIESDNVTTEHITANTHIELVFVDERTPELQTIVDDITNNKGDNVKVIVLSHTDSGINVITQTLAQYESVDAIHIVSHSFGDGVRLGADVLNADSLLAHEPTLASWAESLSINADLLIYGCELASNDNGLSLIENLSLLTGADVAASVDHTGHSDNGGDWLLEKSTGVIETANLVSNALQAQWNHILASWDSATNTITIDYALDQFTGSATDSRYASLQALYEDAVATSADISLREAVVAANNSGIESHISLSGPDYYLSIEDVDSAVDEDESVTGDLDIAVDLTIIGAGKGQTTITAQAVQDSNEFRALDYHNGISQLTGLTITGGIIDGDGGGIRAANAQVFMDDVEITANQTLGTGIGGGISFSAIYSEARDVDIIDNTSAASGGGIAVTNATMDFFDSTVSANEAPLAAGVLAKYQSTLNFNASTIEGNTASDSGAGIGVFGGRLNLLNDSKVQNNTAAQSGGGIEIRIDTDPLGANFVGNVLIEDSLLFNNTAKNGGGGGVNVTDHGTVAVNKSTLLENVAENNHGGAINAFEATVTMEDSVIENNFAELGRGGGVHGTFDHLWINDSTFTLNKATFGGGLYITSATNANIHSSTFFDNTATSNGGAVFVKADLLSIKNSTIAVNTAENLYGAIGTPGAGASIDLFNSIIANNVSLNNGGNNTYAVQQMAMGVSSTSQGFNVITYGTTKETNFARHYTDIINQNVPTGYVVTADLATTLTSYADSHSKHLALNENSDAIDSGKRTVDTEKDAFGIQSNEFVDVGAVEYLTEDPVNKIFWVNDEANSDTIYRMNENRTGLQKIIEEVDTLVLERHILDVAYDHKTQQLFFIRGVESLAGTEYDIHYATHDGDYDITHKLDTGGIIPDWYVQPGASYKTLALAIEETPDGNPNQLYLAQQIVTPQSGQNDFQILSTPIVEGWDTTNNMPAVWSPIIASASGTTDEATVNITLPIANYQVGQFTALHVVTSSAGVQYISWADNADNTTDIYPFVVAVDGVADRFYTIVDGPDPNINNRLSNELARDISYDPATDKVTAVLSGGFYQHALSPNTGINSLIEPDSPPDDFFADTHYDSSSSQIYWAGTEDSISITTSDLSGTVSFTGWVLADNPVAITIAPLAPVNTPPRIPASPEVVTAPTLILNVAEDVVAAPIDNTVLLALDDGPDGVTPADNIFYTVISQPEFGKLNFNGTPIYNGAQFTQQDINNGLLSYTQDGPDSLQDSITFVISDGVADSLTISRTLEINIANIPDINITSPNLTIAENIPGGNHVFGEVEISDIVHNSGHTVHVLDVNGNPHPDITVNAANNIIANKAFDYELFNPVDPTFNFFLQVENPSGALSAIVEQTVTVTNVNEAPTISGESTFVIDEGSFGALQGDGFTYDATSITVGDVDSTNLAYTIAQNGVAGTDVNFYVDSDGLIKLRPGSEIDFEALSASDNPIELTLMVSDQETPSLLTQHDITVSVQDLTEAPSITGVSNVEVDENLSGSVLGIVNQQGQVSTPMQGLSVEDEKYNADPTNPANAYTLTVHDGTGALPPISSRFGINSDGQLYVKQPGGLDHESGLIGFTLTVRVTDNEGLTDTHPITVALRDVYEPHSIAGAANFAIKENSDDLVQNAAATDVMDSLIISNPENEALDYTILEIDDSDPLNEIATISSRFTFDSNTGKVSLAAGAAINFEQENGPIRLRLYVTDHISDANHDFSIHVQDLPEAPTITGTTSASIDENLFGLSDSLLIDSDTTAIMNALNITDEQFDPALPTINPYSVVVNEVSATGVETLSTRFAINANGQLYVNQPNGLDYESDAQSYLLRIEVTDAEGEVATHDMNVQVQPANESPTFSGNNVGYIEEGSAGILTDSTGLLDMVAVDIVDPELDDNTQSEILTYQVFEVSSPGTPADERFWMDTDGLISLRASEAIDFENESGPIELRIEATDSANNLATHAFFVHIKDRPEAATITGTTSANIDENLFGSTHGLLIDSDTGSEMIGLNIQDEQFDPAQPASNPYSLVVNEVNGTTESVSSLFAINNNGQLYVNNADGLDFETTQQYLLRVVVTDAENLVTSHDVTVQVNPVNEPPTITGPLNFSLAENNTGFLQNFGLTADMQALLIDNPEPEALNYQVFEVDAIGNLTLSSRFTFDGNNGKVSLVVGGGIDFEQQSGPIKLVLEVSDQINNVAEHAFNVLIHDISEAPTISGTTSATISENQFGPSDGVLIDLSTSATMNGLSISDEQHDPSQPKQNPIVVVVKEVVGTTEFISSRFAMNPAGQIYIVQNGGLDYESDPQSYSLLVEVTDSEGLTDTHALSVSLTPINESPVISGIGQAYISENLFGLGTGTLIDSSTNIAMAGLSVNDEEHNFDPNTNPLILAVEEGGTPSNRFGIDASGVIYVSQANGLNYEANADPIDITITVTDNGGLVATHGMSVIVTNINELQTINVASALEINENTTDIPLDSATGQAMAPIQANDPDGNTLTYAIENTGPLSSLFSLTSDNRIQLNTPLNYESVIEQNTNSIINLQVSVTDNEPGGQTVTQNVEVTVLDVNDAPVHNVALSDLTATENESFEFIVPTSTFTDEDGQTPTVYVSLANGDPVPSWLNAEHNDQNELVLSGIPADADSGTTNNLIAWAVDSSNASSPFMPFQLVVESKNQVPDDIELSTFSGQMAIPETIEGFKIGTLTTVDNDQADTDHQYSIIGAQNQSRFEIDNEGVLQLREGVALDYETEQLVSIDIQTDDQAGGQLIKTFNLNVLDQNEAPHCCSADNRCGR